MRQAGLLVASFIVTLTLLSGGFFVMQAFAPAPTPTPAPTPAPTVAPTPAPSPTARPTAAPAATPSAEPTALATSAPSPTGAGATSRPSAAPTAEPTPAPTVAPSPVESASASPAASASAPAGPEGKIQVVVLGSQYVNSAVPPNGSVKLGNGGVITFQTDRTISEQLEMDWELPQSAIPAGFMIRSMDVRICGTGKGDFWETYGPEGSTPDEIEFKPPQADGCWHFAGAPGPDTTVKAMIRLQSAMTITRLEYTVTVSK